MSSHDHDKPFLTRLHEHIDEDPNAWVNGRRIADDLDIDTHSAEQVLARLKRDGYLEERGVASRLGDTHLDAELIVTARGAEAANRRRL